MKNTTVAIIVAFSGLSLTDYANADGELTQSNGFGEFVMAFPGWG